ncbi:hypothetical protein OA333_02880 [Candidatus Pelagibacter sp.]|nr:hypothetical protein [Candidatus Pelagibacter sp.]
MVKYIFIILLMFYLPQCSFKNLKSKLVVVSGNIDKNDTNLIFDRDMSYEEFKNKIIEYGEKSDYPKLD